jgi:hypothetical protein
MNYCTKCGGKIENGMAFCGNCGASTEGVSHNSESDISKYNDSITAKTKSKKRTPIIIMAVVIVLLAALNVFQVERLVSVSSSEVQNEAEVQNENDINYARVVIAQFSAVASNIATDLQTYNAMDSKIVLQGTARLKDNPAKIELNELIEKQINQLNNDISKTNKDERYARGLNLLLEKGELSEISHDYFSGLKKCSASTISYLTTS